MHSANNTTDCDAYWKPICELVTKNRCWTRSVVRDELQRYEGYWGQLLLLPTRGYIETSGGPVRLRSVRRIEIVPVRVRKSSEGNGWQVTSVQAEVVSGLGETSAHWTIEEVTWSADGAFPELEVPLIRLVNPCFEG